LNFKIPNKCTSGEKELIRWLIRAKVRGKLIAAPEVSFDLGN
jgi:hypothetical protein